MRHPQAWTAALLQAEQPVFFASRALTSTEQNYCQLEKELLAVVFALQPYVYGRAVIIESGNQNKEATARCVTSHPKNNVFKRQLALVGKFLIKFSSLSAPTKIEELTAGSDEKTQRSPAGNRTQDLANSSRTL